jgi:hypothetical protein
MVIQFRDGNVEFRFYRPEARSVSLTGDFNDWSRVSLPMRMGSDGWWRCQLRIAPGCYHFRYLSDGEWFLDYAAFGLDHGPRGLNSVVCIETPPSSVPLILIGGKAVGHRQRTARTSRRMTATPIAQASRLRPPSNKATLPSGA